MEKIQDYGSAVAFCKKHNLPWQKKKKEELLEMIEKYKKEKDGQSDLQQTEVHTKETEKKFQNVDDMLVTKTKIFDDKRFNILELEDLIINNICNKVSFVYDIDKIYEKYITIDNPNQKSASNLAIEVALSFFLNGN